MDTPPLCVYPHALWGGAQHVAGNIRCPGRAGADAMRLFPHGSPPKTVVEIPPATTDTYRGWGRIKRPAVWRGAGEKKKVFGCMGPMGLLRAHERPSKMVNGNGMG